VTWGCCFFRGVFGHGAAHGRGLRNDLRARSGPRPSSWAPSAWPSSCSWPSPSLPPHRSAMIASRTEGIASLCRTITPEMQRGQVGVHFGELAAAATSGGSLKHDPRGGGRVGTIRRVRYAAGHSQPPRPRGGGGTGLSAAGRGRTSFGARSLMPEEGDHCDSFRLPVADAKRYLVPCRSGAVPKRCRGLIAAAGTGLPEPCLTALSTPALSRQPKPGPQSTLPPETPRRGRRPTNPCFSYSLPGLLPPGPLRPGINLSRSRWNLMRRSARNARQSMLNRIGQHPRGVGEFRAHCG
jgi:hypothetical protein